MHPNYFVTEKEKESKWTKTCVVMWLVGTIVTFLVAQAQVVLSVARTGCLWGETPLTSETAFMVVWSWIWTTYTLLLLSSFWWGSIVLVTYKEREIKAEVFGVVKEIRRVLKLCTSVCTGKNNPGIKKSC
jgi:hypothetical protein